MLTTLRQIIELVLKETDIKKSLHILVQKTKSALGADCCSVYLIDEGRDRFRLIATDGLSASSEGKVTLQNGEGLVGLVGLSHKVLNLADAQIHPNFKFIPEIGEEDFKSFLGVPVEHDGNILGVLVIQQKESREFNETEESFLVTLAAQLASVLYLSELKHSDEGIHIPHSCAFGFGGIAIARSWVWQPHLGLDQVLLKKGEDPEIQQELYHQALFQLQMELDNMGFRIRDSLKGSEFANFFNSYQEILASSAFNDDIDSLIADQNWSASSAVKIVAENQIRDRKEKGQREEAIDIKDLAERLVSSLTHGCLEDLNFKESVILIAEEITAPLIAEMPRGRLAGLVSLRGSDNSLAAILARNLNIPTVMGVKLPMDKLDRHLFIIDGIRHELMVDPPAGVIQEYRGTMLASQQHSRSWLQEKDQTAVTTDGIKIEIDLNAGLSFGMSDKSVQSMIDGVGLYRTEIEFMMSSNMPDEEKQYGHYHDFLNNFAGKRVRMRTLDIGGEKPLPYMPQHEDNPFLGWRGIRISLDHPEWLKTQYRAMLRAAEKTQNLEIMLPMVSSLDEVKAAKKILEESYKEVVQESGINIPFPKFGVMLEVPAVLFLLEDLNPYVDFFSIGSNDLTQYMMAVDRNNPKVEKLYDFFQPSMIRVLHRLLRICSTELHKPIAVSGEMAGCTLGALLLISIGYNEFSMNFTAIPEVKYVIRRVDTAELHAIFAKAIKMNSAQEIKQLYVDYASKNNLPVEHS